MTKSSRLSGFFKLPIASRREQLLRQCSLSGEALEEALEGGGLTVEAANELIENAVGTFSLPLGIATNFLVNDRDYLVPMAIEEPSVVAAASLAAKIVRQGGGFFAEPLGSEMIAQVELRDVPNLEQATRRIYEAKAELLQTANQIFPRLVERGGGARDIEVRVLDATTLAVHLLVDCRDAMGANLVNTLAEALSGRLATLAGGRAGLRILSNLADRRCVRVRCRIPASELAFGAFHGEAVARGIEEASRFAEIDPYRATTHNKGILNGVDAVVMATGNDWRQVEAGAHAYAATRPISERPCLSENGHSALSFSTAYRPLAVWRVSEAQPPQLATTHGSNGKTAHKNGSPNGANKNGVNQNGIKKNGAAGANAAHVLEGVLEMPLALGIVGGALSVHRGAQAALRILGVDSAQELAFVAASAGLATNFSALRALATEGIQRGHMTLHARSVAQAEPERAREILARHSAAGARNEVGRDSIAGTIEVGMDRGQP